METTTSSVAMPENTQPVEVPITEEMIQDYKDHEAQEGGITPTSEKDIDARVEFYNQEPFAALKEIYQVDAITELRQTIQSAQQKAHEAAGGRGLKARFAENAAKKQTIADYIEARGIANDSSEYKRINNDLEKFAHIPDYDWYRGGNSESEGPQLSFRTRLMVGAHLEKRIDSVNMSISEPSLTDSKEDLFQEEAGGLPEIAETTDTAEASAEVKQEKDPSIEAAESHLEGLRTKMAELSAQRQSRLFTLEGGKLNQQYETLQAEYNEQIQKLGKLKLSEVISDESLTVAEKNAQTIAFLFDEQAQLREESREILKNTKVSKIIDWLNRGNKAARILKGAGVGVVAAGAGAALGAAAGVAGVAALGVAGAAALTGAARFARGFARSDARKGRGLEGLDASHKDTMNEQLTSKDAETDTQEVSMSEAQQYLDAQLEKDIEAEQKKRRKSAAAGLGGIALGAGIGIAAQAAVDAGIFDGWMNRNLTGEVGASPQPEVTVETEEAPEVAPAEEPVVEEEVKEILDQDQGDEAQYEAESDYTPEATYDPAFDIAPGEGGIAFFQSLGLTEADWYSVHQDLLNNFPNDFYSEYGDTRLARPGQLSLEAQEYIKSRFNV